MWLFLLPWRHCGTSAEMPNGSFPTVSTGPGRSVTAVSQRGGKKTFLADARLREFRPWPYGCLVFNGFLVITVCTIMFASCINCCGKRSCSAPKLDVIYCFATLRATTWAFPLVVQQQDLQTTRWFPPASQHQSLGQILHFFSFVPI